MFAQRAGQIELVIHTAAQPSHDWAASDPHTDFEVNALGTLNLLEATRRHADGATFVHCSTNKVYGDTPNSLPLVELEQRLELAEDHVYFRGHRHVDVDRPQHAFAVRRLQGRGRPARAGVRALLRPADRLLSRRLPTGPTTPATMLHGFLSYLMRATVTGEPYTVFGYGGKQVRDNIHSADLVAAFEAFHAAPRAGGAVYNIGGGRLQLLDARGDRALSADRRARAGLDAQRAAPARRPSLVDQRPAPVRARLSRLALTRSLQDILREIHEQNAERWLAGG